ncbi:Hypothetical protein NTJ_04742 [Nesidiocoris tenuis]|uniref:Uncharacterized protein n=1 Tax=Nesidiocoris tenuis TaxID=355587 RepID=A0ABN7AI37_9HEMI|nr:Hypothetical protein NTJ_04742 [Nesidiocoris tenuis]
MASNQGQPPEEKVLGFTLTKGQERDEKCDKEDARESPIFDMQMKANNWPRPVRRTTSEMYGGVPFHYSNSGPSRAHPWLRGLGTSSSNRINHPFPTPSHPSRG